jgi:formate/nitrite transporter FocA (FNT family)
MSQQANQAYRTQDPGGQEPSIGELISNLARDTQTLVRQEVALAKTEVNQSVKQLVSSLVKVIVGGLILYAGLLVLLFAAVAGVHKLDFSWAVSALIVGAVTLVIGLILVQMARSGLRGSNLMPTETIESLKDDRDWAKGQVR